MNDASAGPPVYGQPYHTGYMVQMTLNEPLGAVKRVNPNDHILLIYLVREFEKVPRGFRGFLFVNALHLI